MWRQTEDTIVEGLRKSRWSIAMLLKKQSRKLPMIGLNLFVVIGVI